MDEKKVRRSTPGSKTAAKRIRNAQVIAKVAQGASVTQVTKETGLSRTHISRILNSDQVDEIATKLQSDLVEMGDKLLDTFKWFIDNKETFPVQAFQGVVHGLKTLGVLTEQAPQINIQNVTQVSNEDLCKRATFVLKTLQKNES